MKTYKTKVSRFQGNEVFLAFGSGESKFPYPLAAGVQMQPDVMYQVDINNDIKPWTIVSATPLPDNDNYQPAPAVPSFSAGAFKVDEYNQLAVPQQSPGQAMKKDRLITATAVLKVIWATRSAQQWTNSEIVGEAFAIADSLLRGGGSSEII